MRIAERLMIMYLKRGFLAFMIFMTVLCTAFPSLADNITDGSCGPNLTWTYNSETKTLTISGTGTMPNYDDLTVKGGMFAPWVKASSIGDNLEKVEILDGVANIGENAFYYCGKLKSITIANSVTSIGSGAFYHCDSLMDITIPESVTFIGDNAFSYCNGLTSITIPGTVTNIGDGAFSSCDGLRNVTISDGVQRIGEYAFYWCGALENISLPDSLTEIGVNAFYLTQYYPSEPEWDVLYIDNHLIKACEWNFNHNEALNEYTVKSGTVSMADNAFEGCEKLENITLPESLVSIGKRAFYSCSGLTDIEIPQGVTYIGDYAFETCTALTSIRVAEDNPAYCSENGVLYSNDKSEIVRFPCKKTDTAFAIPDGVTTVADGAFERCWDLTGIVIPKGVTKIGNDAFNYCSALTDIIIPEGVTLIGDRAFYECSDLKNATIPNSIFGIGEYAFSGCSKLTKVYYIGDETDWGEIAKGKNYSIPDSIIEYCKGISAKRTEDGKIVVKPIKMNSGTVILALYDGNGLAQMQTEKYNGTEITFETSKAYTYAKVMVWSDLERLFPECDARILK